MKLKLVKNWKTGWRWFSVWSFTLIVFFATTPLPPEITSLLPEDGQKYLIAFVAMCGLILRFVKQSDPANIKYRFDGKTDNKANKADTAQAQTNQAKAVNNSGANHDRHH